MDVCEPRSKIDDEGGRRRGGGCLERKSGDTPRTGRRRRQTDEDGYDDGRSIVLFASSMGGRVSVDIIVVDGVDSVDIGVGVDV